MWDLDVNESLGGLPEVGGSSHGQLTSLGICRVITQCCEEKSTVFQLDRVKT